MKHIFVSLLIIVLNAFVFSVASAQEIKPQPYWVIEDNIKIPKLSTVYFYTADHNLMYKEVVQGKKINVNRRKVVKQLNATLQELQVAWGKELKPKTDEQLVAKRL
jgi:hypothetical protein